jgi:DNA-binding transcriptional LysR family regulator
MRARCSRPWTGWAPSSTTFQNGVAGVVSITANASTIAQFLPAQIGSFLRLHPVLKIDLQERASTEVVKAVQAGLADIGVIEGNTPAENLECLPYRTDELAVIVARDHPLARRKRIGVEEVLRHDHIVVREGTALHRVLLSAALEAQVPLKVRMQVGSFDMVCRMVEQGVGIGVLPYAAMLSQLQILKLRCLKLDAPWAVRRHLLCVRKPAGADRGRALGAGTPRPARLNAPSLRVARRLDPVKNELFSRGPAQRCVCKPKRRHS